MRRQHGTRTQSPNSRQPTAAWQAANDVLRALAKPGRAGGRARRGRHLSVLPGEPPRPLPHVHPPAVVSRPNVTCAREASRASPGAWRIRLWLVDEAGNQNEQTAREIPLRWDPEPPSVTDARSRRQTIRRGSTWRLQMRCLVSLRRRSSSAARGIRLGIRWPSSRPRAGSRASWTTRRSPPGTYSVRARARDHAGNEKSTETSPMSITSPSAARRRTLPLAGPNVVRAGATRPPRVLIRKPRSRYGKTIRLAGRLTSPGGNPLVGSRRRDFAAAQASGR